MTFISFYFEAAKFVTSTDFISDETFITFSSIPDLKVILLILQELQFPRNSSVRTPSSESPIILTSPPSDFKKGLIFSNPRSTFSKIFLCPFLSHFYQLSWFHCFVTNFGCFYNLIYHILKSNCLRRSFL